MEWTSSRLLFTVSDEGEAMTCRAGFGGRD
uniref:Uncharacterized protein n=1 Tax=Arundo donax TaxID=35708 RepID=A0A0A9FHH1_ARUDO